MGSASSKRRGSAPKHGATFSLVVGVVAAALSALVPSGCLKLHEQEETNADVARCTSCHGDAKRSGDALSRSAPPSAPIRFT
jgi:cytochrome c553